MVNALLAGTKTQTRRMVKYPQPKDKSLGLVPWISTPMGNRLHVTSSDGIVFETGSGRLSKGMQDHVLACPHGEVGDRLWVRETWMHGGYAAPGYARKYRADGLEIGGLGDFEGEPWRPSIFMPRWASRITLEITDVRVERLQDISEEDAKAEGVEPATLYLSDECGPYVASYSTLWEKINGKGSWEANPWVWAVSFRRIT
jgi:hypothetical protein